MTALSDLARRDADALTLLQQLTGPLGIQASRSADATPEYRAVFARDGIMAGLAGLLAGDAEVTEGLVRTLATLREHQGAQGQIASNVRRNPDGSWHVSYGTLAPRLDSATWFLLGVGFAVRAGVVDAAMYRDAVQRTVALLDGIEYNGRHLLYVPAGGNWADEYVTEGYILYDQVLRGWSLRVLGAAFGEPQWTAKAAAIGARIEEAFASTGAWPRVPLASFTPIAVQARCDLAACALLALSDLAPAMADEALHAIRAQFLDAPRLPPVFHPIITPTDADWPALRRYHLHAFRNTPHEYHNGGVWPVWLGWLALALAHRGHDDALALLREQVTRTLAAHPTFQHHEFLHGERLEPLGNVDMAYTATGLVFLARAGSPAQTVSFA